MAIYNNWDVVTILCDYNYDQSNLVITRYEKIKQGHLWPVMTNYGHLCPVITSYDELFSFITGSDFSFTT